MIIPLCHVPLFVVCVCGESCDCNRGPVSQNLPRGLSARASHPGNVCGFVLPGSNNVDRGKVIMLFTNVFLPVALISPLIYVSQCGCLAQHRFPSQSTPGG